MTPGISVLEFGVPLEGGNVNRKENVCTCEPLSEEVAKYLDPETTETSCVQESDDPDTFDLSNCDTSDWRCYDGIMDISNVMTSFSHISVSSTKNICFSVKDLLFTSPSLTTILLMINKLTLQACLPILMSTEHILMLNPTLESRSEYTTEFRSGN